MSSRCADRLVDDDTDWNTGEPRHIDVQCEHEAGHDGVHKSGPFEWTEFSVCEQMPMDAAGRFLVSVTGKTTDELIWEDELAGEA